MTKTLTWSLKMLGSNFSTSECIKKNVIDFNKMPNNLSLFAQN